MERKWLIVREWMYDDNDSPYTVYIIKKQVEVQDIYLRWKWPFIYTKPAMIWAYEAREYSLESAKNRLEQIKEWYSKTFVNRDE